MRVLLFVLLALPLGCGDSSAGASSSDPAAAPPTVFYLTRHAEKAAGDDPDLLPEGEERARRIARRLQSEDLAAVYATGYRRTQSTAAPTAQQQGLSVTTYDVRKKAKTLTDRWLREHRGRAVLVVGHSNTIPDMLNALLGERRYSDFGEANYDRFYRVTVPRQGRPTITQL